MDSKYLDEIKILRGEITLLKNIVNKNGKASSASSRVSYKKDEEGNIITDSRGNPVVNEAKLNSSSALLLETFKKYFNLQYKVNENGDLVLDEDKQIIIDTKTIGFVTELIISLFDTHFKIPYKKDENGLYKRDEDDNKIMNNDILDINTNFIPHKLLQYFNYSYLLVKEGEDEGKFVLDAQGNKIVDEEHLGIIIKLILKEFDKINKKLDTIISKL